MGASSVRGREKCEEKDGVTDEEWKVEEEGKEES